MILTCTGQGTYQRWTVQNNYDVIFTVTHQPGTQHIFEIYIFTLISSASHHFVSTLSTVATSVSTDVEVECGDVSSIDTVTIRIEGIAQLISLRYHVY